MGNAIKNGLNQVPCCVPGPPLKGRSGSLFGSSQKLDGSDAYGSHSIMRGSVGTDEMGGPRMRDFIFVPWIIAVCILLITVLSFGCSWTWAVIPALLVCGATAALSWQKYKRGEQPLAIFYVMCCIAGFAALIVSLVTYFHFLQPYNQLSGGATYLDMLPSQSALGASDATALVFAAGTSIDTSRTFGYVDARNPDGTIYCVAPVSNKWTLAEPGVQFFAAGTDCCGKRSGFGCGQGGTGSRGATVLASEFTAAKGFKNAVEGAAVAYTLQPGNGYLLLNMMEDPMAYRQDKLDGAVKILLVYMIVYLLIACMTGYMAHNAAKK